MSDHQYHINDEKVKKQQQQQMEDASPTVSQQVDTNDVTGMQQIIGNQGVQRMINQQHATKPSTFIQAKMSVGPADDAYEREADNVANQVMTAPDVAQREAEDEDMMAKRDYLQREAEDEDIMAKRDYLQRDADAEDEDDAPAPASGTSAPAAASPGEGRSK